jgi:hypothetical protein
VILTRPRRDLEGVTDTEAHTGLILSNLARLAYVCINSRSVQHPMPIILPWTAVPWLREIHLR